jgi:hypothetical protein
MLTSKFNKESSYAGAARAPMRATMFVQYHRSYLH